MFLMVPLSLTHNASGLCLNSIGTNYISCAFCKPSKLVATISS